MSEPRLSLVPGGDSCVAALEALRRVRDEYGLDRLAKPCVALVLDGNLGGADRHKAAFVLALGMRALELSPNHGVADELFHAAAVPFDDRLHPLEIARQQRT